MKPKAAQCCQSQRRPRLPVCACPPHDLRAVKMPRETRPVWSGRGGCRRRGDGVRTGGEHQWVRTRRDLQLPLQHLCKKLSNSRASPILRSSCYFRHHLPRRSRCPNSIFYNQMQKHTDRDLLGGGKRTRSLTHLHISLA